MDKQSLITYIVDILRNGKENQALAAGGPTAAPPGMQLPQAQAPLHEAGGQRLTPDQIALMAERG